MHFLSWWLLSYLWKKMFQWQQLQVVPVFLGFLTYKAALIAYTLWTAVLPNQS